MNVKRMVTDDMRYEAKVNKECMRAKDGYILQHS